MKESNNDMVESFHTQLQRHDMKCYSFKETRKLSDLPFLIAHWRLSNFVHMSITEDHPCLTSTASADWHPSSASKKNLAPAGRRLKIPVYPPVPAGSQVSTVRREHHNTELVQKELNTGRELTAKVALYSMHFECKGGIWHVERQI